MVGYMLYNQCEEPIKNNPSSSIGIVGKILLLEVVTQLLFHKE